MGNILPFPTAPNTKKELFGRLRTIIASGWQQMPVSSRSNGTGAPGNFLEDLIGLNAGNKDIPDITGWEVKFYSPETTLITLFHKEPQPRTALRYLVKRYGWLDDEGRLGFRHTIRGESDRFKVFNDAGNVIVRPFEGSGIVPMWTHDTLLNVAGGKLRRLMLVKGERKGQTVRFNQVDCFEDLHLTRLIDEIIKGTIAIDFDAREMRPGSNALRNHGTKFRVAPDNIANLYIKRERLS
jgi:hypothetical protein